MITKREIEYGNFGKCLEISNGIVTAVVTLDIGPRIIRYSFVGGENVLYEDRERLYFKSGAALDDTFGKGSVWYNYGGHRLWASPEGYPKSYCPDNSPVPYKITDRGAIFSPAPQKQTGYQYEIETEMSEDSGEITVKMGVTNCSKKSMTVAPWAISALCADGTIVVQQPEKDAGVLPNRRIALWSYDRMTDRRFKMLDRYVILRHDSKADDIPFKFGMNSEHGYSMFFAHGDVFVKRFEAKPDGVYPDGNVNFEAFTNELFIEMESLGELATLSPGETARHTERWSLFRAPAPELNDAKLDEFVKKYI